MDRKRMKQLQALSHRLNRNQTDLAQEFMDMLKTKLAERKYRADLNFVTAAKNTQGSFNAEIRYNPELGYPDEQDLLTLVAQNAPDHDINWELVDVDEGSGLVTLFLEPSVEVLPVTSVKAIPSEFVAIGTGIYKRAADNTGKVHEIWTLKKGEDGLALYRSQHDLEVTADDDGGFKAGDIVFTEEYGPGRIQRFDDLGNAFVTVGNKTHLVAAMDLKKYDKSKEESALRDYFAQAYGDPSFADALVKNYGDTKK